MFAIQHTIVALGKDDRGASGSAVSLLTGAQRKKAKNSADIFPKQCLGVCFTVKPARPTDGRLSGHPASETSCLLAFWIAINPESMTDRLLDCHPYFQPS